MSKMQRLASYMKERAAFEGVEWALTEGFLKAHYAEGVRVFFGVTVDKDGALLRDVQQPVFLFEKFHSALRN